MSARTPSTTRSRRIASGRRGKVGAAAILLVVVTGCAASPPEWTKPGATSADLRRDLGDCEREATGPGPFRFWALSMDYDAATDRIARVRRQCMEARGWRLVRSD